MTMCATLLQVQAASADYEALTVQYCHMLAHAAGSEISAHSKAAVAPGWARQQVLQVSSPQASDTVT